MNSVLIIKIIVVALALVGFYIAAVIAHHKAAKKPLVCPMRSRCDLVTESEHSRFMGIHNEHLGLLYYALVAGLFATSIFVPDVLGAMTRTVLFVLPALGFLFSMYLTLLQGFVIKQWCAWCLGSATIATAIFFVVIYAAPAGFL
jgi:uncharacterized membrane protein